MENLSEVPTTLTLEGDPEVYSFLYDFNTICDAEPETGENLLQFIFAIGTSASILLTARQMRAMAYALLKPMHAKHGLTVNEVGALLSRDTMAVTSTIMKALGRDQKPTPATAAADFLKGLGIAPDEATVNAVLAVIGLSEDEPPADPPVDPPAAPPAE